MKVYSDTREIYVLVDNVRSAYNVGSIFRTADAVAVSKIFLCGISGVERFGNKVSLHPKVAKTALDGVNVPWEYCEEPVRKLEELKKVGVEIISLEITKESKKYSQTKYKTPLCIVIGHERNGIQDKLLELSNKVVSIPMLGAGKSLNVAVALGIVISEARRQLDLKTG